MKRMTPAQKIMMLAEQQAVFHTAETDRLIELDPEHPHIEFQARSAVDALTTLGRFDEARTYTHLCGTEYAEQVDHCEMACQVDDDECCGCTNQTAPIIEGGVEMGVEEVPRYIIEKPAIFNPVSGRLDPVYLCIHCGHRNATERMHAAA